MGTWLTDRLGIDVPLVQAPMARVSEGALAAAVSGAGALGMVGVGSAASPEWIVAQTATASSSGKPYGVGLMAWALSQEQLDAVLESDATVVSVSFGPFEEPLRRAKEAGKVVTTQVGNLDEARRAEQAGVDFVVARGREGGGHGRDDLGTLPLLQLVLDTVDVPVVAAGGIANARGLAAVLAAGAVGGWVGTAFLCCPESAFPAESRARLIAADDTATVYGRVFDVAQRAGWPPEFGGRSLRNRFYSKWAGREAELAEDPAAAEEYAAAQRARDFDTAVVYAGQGAALLRAEASAAEVVQGFAAAQV